MGSAWPVSSFCWGHSGSVGAGGFFPRMDGFLVVSRKQPLIAWENAASSAVPRTCLLIPQKACALCLLNIAF